MTVEGRALSGYLSGVPSESPPDLKSLPRLLDVYCSLANEVEEWVNTPVIQLLERYEEVYIILSKAYKPRYLGNFSTIPDFQCVRQLSLLTWTEPISARNCGTKKLHGAFNNV